MLRSKLDVVEDSRLASCNPHAGLRAAQPRKQARRCQDKRSPIRGSRDRAYLMLFLIDLHAHSRLIVTLNPFRYDPYIYDLFSLFHFSLSKLHQFRPTADIVDETNR